MQYGKKSDLSSSVLSLSILDRSTFENGSMCGSTRIQVLVRNPGTNATHPNVISMPTQRIPRVLLHDILSSAEVEARHGTTTYYRGGAVDNSSGSGHHPVIYAVESLLSRKLGVSGELESGALAFIGALRAATTGKAYYPNLPPGKTEEYITMVNIAVIVTKGANLFPSKTQSYSHMFWTDVGRFLKAIRNKDPVLLNAGLDPTKHCIRGLCTLVAYSAIIHQFGTEAIAY
jgi:hypothetical protein